VKIAGLPTNIPFLRVLAKHPAFMAGDVGTDFIDKYRSELLPTIINEPSKSANAAFQDPSAFRKAAAVAAVGICLMKPSSLKGKSGKDKYVFSAF
jgi:3-methylcrotonyl-CoA carboxylase alpha subunit